MPIKKERKKERKGRVVMSQSTCMWLMLVWRFVQSQHSFGLEATDHITSQEREDEREGERQEESKRGITVAVGEEEEEK